LRRSTGVSKKWGGNCKTSNRVPTYKCKEKKKKGILRRSASVRKMFHDVWEAGTREVPKKSLEEKKGTKEKGGRLWEKADEAVSRIDEQKTRHWGTSEVGDKTVKEGHADGGGGKV